MCIHRHSQEQTASAFATDLNRLELSVLCQPGTAPELGKTFPPIASWMVMDLLFGEVCVLYVTAELGCVGLQTHFSNWTCHSFNICKPQCM